MSSTEKEQKEEEEKQKYNPPTYVNVKYTTPESPQLCRHADLLTDWGSWEY